MSEVKVNKVSPRSGTGVQLGDAGDTITVPNSANLTVGGTLTATTGGGIANAALANSAITINGSAVSLGGSVTVGETKPTISGISPSTITNDATNVVISGTNFVSIPQVEAIASNGAVTAANSVSFSSATSITANFTLTDAPGWTTAAGSLGTIAGNFSGTVATVAASGDTVTFSETTNVLTNASQANCALNSSTGVITTTDFGGSSTTPTLYTFTLRATDAQGQTADRVFTLQSSFGSAGSGGFN